jgi:ribosomal protein S18 acetylase RimI-like enzyme
MAVTELNNINQYFDEIVNMHSSSIWESLDDSRRQNTTKHDIKERAYRQITDEIKKNRDSNIIIISQDEKNTLNGFIWVELVNSPFSGEKTGHIVDIHVKEDFRRQGIANSLILKIQENLKNLGVIRITLNVSGKNFPAQRLYEKHCFSIEMLKMTRKI